MLSNRMLMAASGSRHPAFIDILTDLGLTTGLKLCLDAGDENSFTSGQKWLDVSGGGYDWFLGADGSATTDDPTFNGSPGGLSANEYFSLDGGDYFAYDTTIEAWMEALHKNGGRGTALAVDYFPTMGGTISVGFGTYAAGSAESGILNSGDAANKQALYIDSDSSGNDVAAISDTAIPNNQWNFRASSWDDASKNTGFFHLNGAINQVSASNTFAVSMAGTTAASRAPQLYAIPVAANLPPNGTRTAIYAMWESADLTEANLEAIFAEVRTRFGI